MYLLRRESAWDERVADGASAFNAAKVAWPQATLAPRATFQPLDALPPLRYDSPNFLS